MFRRLFAISLLLISAVGCTFGVVRITKDNFKNSHTVNLKLELKSEESILGTLIDTPFTKYRVEMDFTREIGEGKLVPTIGRVTVFATTQNTGLERSGFLKIGEKMSQLAFGNSSVQSVTTTVTRSNAQGGNTSAPSYGYGAGTGTGVTTSSSTHLRLNTTFLLKKEEEDEILKSNSFTIRFYSGAEPITVVIEESDLDKFKEYLTARPE